VKCLSLVDALSAFAAEAASHWIRLPLTQEQTNIVTTRYNKTTSKITVVSAHLSASDPLSLCSRGSFPLDSAVLLSRIPLRAVRSVLRRDLIRSLSPTLLRRVCVFCTMATLLNTARASYEVRVSRVVSPKQIGQR
jgi:hypothetical protein